MTASDFKLSALPHAMEEWELHRAEWFAQLKAQNQPIPEGRDLAGIETIWVQGFIQAAWTFSEENRSLIEAQQKLDAAKS